MQGKLGVQVDRISVEIAFWPVVDHVVSRESIKLVELVRHQHFAERLIWTISQGVQFRRELGDPAVESGHLIGLSIVALQEILVLLV